MRHKVAEAGEKRKAHMPKRAVYHVVPSKEGWRVELEGAARASAVEHLKVDALDRATELAKTAPLGQVKIHGEDGQIQREYTYGADPRRTPG